MEHVTKWIKYFQLSGNEALDLSESERAEAQIALLKIVNDRIVKKGPFTPGCYSDELKAYIKELGDNQ